MEPLGQELKKLSDDTARIDGEIRGYFTQEHIKESKNYAAEGKSELAVEAAQKAVSVLSSAAEEKLPAPPAYFVDTIRMINGVAQISVSPALSKSLQDARLSLAQYRSALLVGTVTYTQKITVQRIEHAFTLNKGSVIQGGYFDASRMTGEFAVLAPGYKAGLSDNFAFRGTIITGGMQTLDEVHWVNVTFIGTKIRYAGGELDLDHVSFIGCTFEAPDSDRGARFAEYAALLIPKLVIS